MKRVFRVGLWLSLMALCVMAFSSPVQAGCNYSSYGSYGSYYPSYYYPPSYTYNTYYAAVVPTPVALFQFVAPAAAATTVTQQTTTTQTTQQQQAAAVLGVATGVTATTTASQASLISDAQLERLAVVMADRIVLSLKGPAPKEKEYAPPPEKELPKNNGAKPPPSSMPREGASNVSPQEKLKVAYKVAAISADKCIACHQAGNSPKGKSGSDAVILFTAEGQFQPNVTPLAMAAAVKDDVMPHGTSPKLTVDEKRVFAQFAAQ